MSPRGIFTHVGSILHILDCLGQVNAGYLQVLYLGRAPRTKETLPDFLKWRRVTRHPLVFRRLTGSQRTPRVWGVTAQIQSGVWVQVARAFGEVGLTFAIKSEVMFLI